MSLFKDYDWVDSVCPTSEGDFELPVRDYIDKKQINVIREAEIYKWIAQTCYQDTRFTQWYFKNKEHVDDMVSILMECIPSDATLLFSEHDIIIHCRTRGELGELTSWVLSKSCYIIWRETP